MWSSVTSTRSACKAPCWPAQLRANHFIRPTGTARASALRATATVTARIHPTATATSTSRPTATATEIYAVICPVPSRRVHRQTTPWLPHRPPQAKKKNGTKIVGNSPLLLTTIRLPARALVLPLPLRPSLDLPLPLRRHAMLPLPPNASWGVGSNSYCCAGLIGGSSAAFKG